MFIKRLFDVFLSFIGLLVLLPIFLAIAIMIKIKMTGPILFKQERIGQYGKVFKIIKFRTMKLDHSKSPITVKGEHRITPLGSFLRKYKLDELPELFNVLIGQMSLVGPRPDVRGYADKLIGEDKLILNLKPGITGPASLKYANEEELLAKSTDPKRFNDEILFPDKVAENLNYYHNRSFGGDIKIIWKTVFRTY